MLKTRQMRIVIVNSVLAPLCTLMTTSVLSTKWKFNTLFTSLFKINYFKLEYKTIHVTGIFSCIYVILLCSYLCPFLYLSISHLAGVSFLPIVSSCVLPCYSIALSTHAPLTHTQEQKYLCKFKFFCIWKWECYFCLSESNSLHLTLSSPDAPVHFDSFL